VEAEAGVNAGVKAETGAGEAGPKAASEGEATEGEAPDGEGICQPWSCNDQLAALTRHLEVTGCLDPSLSLREKTAIFVRSALELGLATMSSISPI